MAPTARLRRRRIRSFSDARAAWGVSRLRALAAWVAIIGGGIAFYFLYGQIAEAMR